MTQGRRVKVEQLAGAIMRIAGHIFQVAVLFFVLLLPLAPSAHALDECGHVGQQPCNVADGPTGWWGSGIKAIIGFFRRDVFCWSPALLDEKAYMCRAPQVVGTPPLNTPPIQTKFKVHEAMAHGCFDVHELRAIYAKLPPLITQESITFQQLQMRLSDTNGGWMTRALVRDPDTWMYRATDYAWEEPFMMQGILKSRSANYIEKKVAPSDLDSFWVENGPKLTEGSDPFLVRAMQGLALSSSDKPKSQFSSVALSYDVARSFGNIVYKFQGSPNSPIIGMNDDCDLIGGEIQMQVPNGTAIRNLHRKSIVATKWERFEGFNSKGKPVWKTVEAEQSELKRSVKDPALNGFDSVGWFYSNSEYIFDDARLEHKGDAERCAERCAALEECAHFTFGYPDLGVRGQYCTLFEAANFQYLPAPPDTYTLYSRKK